MSTIASLQEQQLNKIAFNRILMATDFSPASRRALDYAVAIARRYNAEISLVHAIPPAPRKPIAMDPLPGELNLEQLEAEEEMETLVQIAHLEDVSHKVMLTIGDAGDVISSIVERDHPDLLVLGTHGRGAIKQLVLGSVAEQVLRRVTCPVLTVGSKAMPPNSNAAEFSSILFATDFGPACTNALNYAVSLAEDSGGKLTLLHLVPHTSPAETGYGMAACAAEDLVAWQQRTQKESLKKLKALIPGDANLPLPPQFVVEINFLPDGILDIANTRNVDLIVMGANRRRNSRFASHLPWSVIHEVLCQGKYPVLTVSS